MSKNEQSKFRRQVLTCGSGFCLQDCLRRHTKDVECQSGVDNIRIEAGDTNLLQRTSLSSLRIRSDLWKKNVLKKSNNCCSSQRSLWPIADLAHEWVVNALPSCIHRDVAKQFLAELANFIEMNLGIKAAEISEEGRLTWSFIRTRSRQDEALRSSCLRRWVHTWNKRWRLGLVKSPLRPEISRRRDSHNLAFAFYFMSVRSTTCSIWI